MNVLVTDGENRSSLAVTRSLGRRGCRVIVAGKTNRNLASSSRLCQQGVQVPDPLSQGTDYVRAICDIADKEAIDVVFPMTEHSIYLLNPARDRLPVLACSSIEKMQTIADKSNLCRLAERLNVPIPQTLYLTCAEDLSGVVNEIYRYPVVIKPALSMRLEEGQKFLSGGVSYAASREELECIYANSKVLRYPSLIQEKIIGPGTGLFTLYDTDRHLALFSHRRLREKPPSGGVSVVSESVPLDQKMVENAERLLSAVRWQGVAMVEFKRDQRDGQAKLMEINGRFWGTLQLAIACGVNFPCLIVDTLHRENSSIQVGEYVVGHKMKWFFGTLDHLLIRLKNKNETLNLPIGSPSKWQALIEFATIWEKNTIFDVFSRDDIGPFWFEARNYIRQSVERKE